MKSDSDAVLGCVGALVLVPAAIGLSWVVEGAVAKQLWTWFIVPTFGLAPLTIAQALGIAFLWSLFSPTPQNKNDDDKNPWVTILTHIFMKPLMALFAGWIVSHWM